MDAERETVRYEETNLGNLTGSSLRELIVDTIRTRGRVSVALEGRIVRLDQ